MGAYIQLLHKISQDSGVKNFLYKTTKKKSASRPNTAATAEITKDNLPQVRNRLKEAITKQTINVESEALKSVTKTTTVHSQVPSVASWIQRRPSMSWDFSSSKTNTHIPAGTIGNIPSNSQENILIEDLLNILIGLPGVYIEPDELRDEYAERTFTVSESVDHSLAELVKQILPLASHYSIVQRFTEQKTAFECGQVNNALAEAMHFLIVDYTVSF